MTGPAGKGTAPSVAARQAADLQVAIYRLQGVADEMGAVLRRAAFSPNIRERADCSAAVFTPAGELLAQAEHIPVHLGSMPASVAAVIEAIAAGPPPAAGEQFIVNDPFAGGTHLNDVTIVVPCLAGGRLVGFVANRAHHADVGGSVPGSIPPEATEIYQEGLRIPPVRCTPEVVAVLLANSRTPTERRGDLEAQLGANRLGAARLIELEAAGVGFEEVCAYGERRMRAALAGVPNGSWSFGDVLEAPPGGDSPGRKSPGGQSPGGQSPGGQSPGGQSAGEAPPPRIEVRLTIDGSEATFDFTGTSPEQAGNVNAVEAVTVSAVAFALRAATDPTIPAGGSLRPVRVVAPAGTLVAARPPAAVGAGNVEVSQRVADVCLGALAQALPGRVGAAGQGTMNNVMIGGRGWVYYETIAGGEGGRPGRRGMSGVHTAMTNTKNTPVEALERELPVRVRRYRLRSGSGGEGRWPGGDGIEREIEVLEPATVSVIGERRTSRPWGLAGGGSGESGEWWLIPGGKPERARRAPARATIRLQPGDVLRILTPGGGGYGELVRRDGH